MLVVNVHHIIPARCSRTDTESAKREFSFNVANHGQNVFDIILYAMTWPCSQAQTEIERGGLSQGMFALVRNIKIKLGMSYPVGSRRKIFTTIYSLPIVCPWVYLKYLKKASIAIILVNSCKCDQELCKYTMYQKFWYNFAHAQTVCTRPSLSISQPSPWISPKMIADMPVDYIPHNRP